VFIYGLVLAYGYLHAKDKNYQILDSESPE